MPLKRRHHPQFNSNRALQIAMVLGAALCMATLPTVARADVIYDYTFTGDSTATIDGVAEAISGSFMYDATTTLQLSAAVTLTGGAPYAGSYGEPTVALSPSGSGIATEDAAGDFLDFSFLNDLFLGDSPVLIADGVLPIVTDVQYFPEAGGDILATDVAGSVVLPSTPSAVPEPASIVLLGGALFGFTAIRRRRRS